MQYLAFVAPDYTTEHEFVMSTPHLFYLICHNQAEILS